jgi:hypothetical protein
VSGTGQALQGDNIPDPAGRVGGEGTGDSTGGGVLHFLGGRVGKVLMIANFHVPPPKRVNQTRCLGTFFCNFFPGKLFNLEMPFLPLSNANHHFHHYKLICSRKLLGTPRRKTK